LISSGKKKPPVVTAVSSLGRFLSLSVSRTHPAESWIAKKESKKEIRLNGFHLIVQKMQSGAIKM
jgi:hypothetical protein